MNTAFGDYRYGLSTNVAGGLLIAILFTLIFGGIHMIIRVLKFNITFTMPYFLIFAS